jgi:hypothetical protein
MKSCDLLRGERRYDKLSPEEEEALRNCLKRVKAKLYSVTARLKLGPRIAGTQKKRRVRRRRSVE